MLLSTTIIHILGVGASRWMASGSILPSGAIKPLQKWEVTAAIKSQKMENYVESRMEIRHFTLFLRSIWGTLQSHHRSSQTWCFCLPLFSLQWSNSFSGRRILVCFHYTLFLSVHRCFHLSQAEMSYEKHKHMWVFIDQV